MDESDVLQARGVGLEKHAPDASFRHCQQDDGQRIALVQGTIAGCPLSSHSRVSSGSDGRRANADTKAAIFSLPTSGRGRLRTPLMRTPSLPPSAIMTASSARSLFRSSTSLTRYLASKAGAGAYASVMMEKAGREAAVVRGLKEGTVDVMTFQEPITSALLATGLATTLYDLNSGESTARALGGRFPAQALLMSPDAIAKRPEVVQRLVNAFVRAMRFVNSHSAEEIAARLPADYFAGKDRRAELELIRAALPTYARGDYSISSEEARLAVDVH